MKALFALLCLLALTSFCFGGDVKPGQIGGGTFGEVYECAFPNSANLDGEIDEVAWRFAPWHVVRHDDGPRPSTSDKDSFYEFAAVADKDFLYVAFKVYDDALIKGETSGCDVYKDDSVEIYIDAGNDGSKSYDANDAQITIGAENIGGDVDKPILGGCIGITQGPQTGTKAAVKKTDYGYVVEAAVPLKSKGWKMEPKDKLVIGFNTHINDDDDGGDDDHILNWSLKDVADTSWEDPSVFGKLKFVEKSLSISIEPVLPITWGQVKRR